jgi:hypothetical protein
LPIGSGLPNFICKNTKIEILGPMPSKDDANFFSYGGGKFGTNEITTNSTVNWVID